MARRNPRDLDQLVQGQVVAGYTIVSHIGGGRSAVYVVTKHGKSFAMKVEIYGPFQQLIQEGEYLKSLQGRPGIPKIVLEARHCAEAKGTILVLELLGGSLHTIRSKRFSTSATCFMAIQMLRGMRTVHEAGFVHRDIKPDNYVLGMQGTTPCIEGLRVYIIDFGLMKKATTVLKGFAGTPRYASLNVLAGKNASRVDDLWSLCYSLMEMSAAPLPWSDTGQGERDRARRYELISFDKRKHCQPDAKFLARVPGPARLFLHAIQKLTHPELMSDEEMMTSDVDC